MMELHLRGNNKAMTAQPGSSARWWQHLLAPALAAAPLPRPPQVPVSVDSAQWPTIVHQARSDSASATTTTRLLGLDQVGWLGPVLFGLEQG
ncbi:hypothetical protein PWT90_05080 [Aphanocladium album]|nr:hypothetical protein PWT90_05080 [Aphanocladium album]